MAIGQWIGKVVGKWLGFGVDADPNAMSGSASFSITATGTLSNIEEVILSPASEWKYSYKQTKNRFFDLPAQVPTVFIDETIFNYESALDNNKEQQKYKYKPINISNALVKGHVETKAIIDSIVEKANKKHAILIKAESERINAINDEEEAIVMMMFELM